jgi:hypothetical protein
MSSQFTISGTFPVKDGVPADDIHKAVREACRTWPVHQHEFEIVPGPAETACFSFGALTSGAFAAEVTKTFQMLALRFADWSKGVMEYSSSFEGSRGDYFFGPENRCIEVKLSAITKRIDDLQSEWTELNDTQLPQASDTCVELTDWAD